MAEIYTGTMTKNGQPYYPPTQANLVKMADGRTLDAHEAEIKGEISDINNAITGIIGNQTIIPCEVSCASGVSILFGGFYKCGNILIVNGLISITSAKSQNDTIVNNISANGSVLKTYGGYIEMNANDSSLEIAADSSKVTVTSGVTLPIAYYRIHGVIPLK